MESALVSIVVPYHNEGDMVNRAIRSICESSAGLSCEIVVVDDFSDAAPPVAEEFTDRVHVVRSDRPLHAAGARNLGAACAAGEYLAFLDADDIYTENRLSPHVEYFHTAPNIVLVGGKTYVHREQSWLQTPGVIETYFPELAEQRCVLPRAFRQRICREYCFTTGSLTVRTGAFQAIGGFRADYRWAAEWDLQVRLAQIGEVGYIPEPAMHYLCRPHSITSTRTAHKFVSAACMYTDWRRTVPNLDCGTRHALKRMTHDALLLASQVYLEDERNSASALAAALRAQAYGCSVWGIRALLRSSLYAVLPSFSNCAEAERC